MKTDTANGRHSVVAPQRYPIADPGWALFLDLDGTLFDLAPTPDDVHPDPYVSLLIQHLAKMFGGAVAIISGRSLRDIDHLVAPCRVPAAGLHGLERRRMDGGIEERAVDTEALHLVREQLSAFVLMHPALLLEDKGKALGMHYRQAPHLGGEVLSLAQRAIAPFTHSLGLQPGKMVVEIKPHGANKGTAISAFMGEEPFAGRRPLVAGDDITDEDAFALVRSFGGMSILVGQPRRTLAHERLPDVSKLRHWLARISGLETA